MARIVYLLTLAVVLANLPAVGGEDKDKQYGHKDKSIAADNTKVNKEDREKGAVTADQQKENKSDREITRQIRRALVKDKSLSAYARNVKIITRDGSVTLKGPVRSEEEKKAVESKAVSVAGDANVKSELTLAPKTE